MPARYKVLLSKRASQDLQSLFGYIAEDSPPNAGAMVDRILQSLELPKIFPRRNVVEGQHPKLKHPVRSLPVPPYMVFFRVVHAHKIVRVLRVR
jgi:plasmid stabilization system protein ParE